MTHVEQQNSSSEEDDYLRKLQGKASSHTCLSRNLIRSYCRVGWTLLTAVIVRWMRPVET